MTIKEFKTNNVPFERLQEAPGDAFSLSAKLSQPEGEDEIEVHKVELLARTGDPLYHWWWGNIVHDMSGFFKHKETVTLDWNHNPDILVGYADKQEATDEGLTLSGKLVVLESGDQADKVVKWRKNGIPLEASIYFDEAEMEYIPEDMATEVNGKQFAGPGVVVRKWTIRGCAICPYGYDGKTETRLSKTKFNFSLKGLEKMDNETESTQTSETELTSGSVITTTTEPAKVDETKLSLEDYRKELNKFTSAFGAENGAKWFGEGVSFSDAQTRQIDLLSKNVVSLREENDKLKNEMKEFRKTLGEERGVETRPGDGVKLARNMTEARSAKK